MTPSPATVDYTEFQQLVSASLGHSDVDRLSTSLRALSPSCSTKMQPRIKHFDSLTSEWHDGDRTNVCLKTAIRGALSKISCKLVSAPNSPVSASGHERSQESSVLSTPSSPSPKSSKRLSIKTSFDRRIPNIFRSPSSRSPTDTAVSTNLSFSSPVSSTSSESLPSSPTSTRSHRSNLSSTSSSASSYVLLTPVTPTSSTSPTGPYASSGFPLTPPLQLKRRAKDPRRDVDLVSMWLPAEDGKRKAIVHPSSQHQWDNDDPFGKPNVQVLGPGSRIKSMSQPELKQAHRRMQIKPPVALKAKQRSSCLQKPQPLAVEEKPVPAFVVEETHSNGSSESMDAHTKVHIGLSDGERDLSFDPDLHLRSDAGCSSNSSCTSSSLSSLPHRRRAKLREVRFQDEDEILGVKEIAPKFPTPPSGIGYSPPSSMRRKLPIGVSDSERMNRMQSRQYAMAASESTPSLLPPPRSASTSPRRTSPQLQPETAFANTGRSRLSLPVQPLGAGSRYLPANGLRSASTATLTLTSPAVVPPRSRSPARAPASTRPSTAVSVMDSDTEGIIAAHGDISFQDDITISLETDSLSPLPNSASPNRVSYRDGAECCDSDVEGSLDRGFVARMQQARNEGGKSSSQTTTTTVAGVKMLMRGNIGVKSRPDSPFPLSR